MTSEAQLLIEVFDRIGHRTPAQTVDRVLAVARRHLAMDVAFVSEVDGDSLVFRAIEGDPAPLGLALGGSRRLEETYCGWILRGALPNLIADAHRDPRAGSLVGVMPELGSYIGVPIEFADGQVFGVLACAGAGPSRWLGPGDEQVLRALADVLAAELEAHQFSWEEHCRELMDARDTAIATPPSIAFQPIVALPTRRVLGVEALARFPHTDLSTADVFRRAWRVGYGAEQEHHAVTTALRELDDLAADVFMAVNISPQLPLAVDVEALIGDVDVTRVVLELTEHSRIEQPRELLARLAPLRRQGLRLAIDDAGAGFAGLNRIIDLEPDILKLDAAIIHGITGDRLRTELVRGLVTYGAHMGTQIVAEGVETIEELATLEELGIEVGQGWLFGHASDAADIPAVIP